MTPTDGVRGFTVYHARMALFGRESEADRRRAERITRWLQARSPYALVSVAAGLLCVVDSFLMLVSLPAGVAAIVLAGLGWRDLARRPDKRGHRLCVAGATLGVLGITLALIVWPLVYEALRP